MLNLVLGETLEKLASKTTIEGIGSASQEATAIPGGSHTATGHVDRTVQVCREALLEISTELVGVFSQDPAAELEIRCGIEQIFSVPRVTATHLHQAHRILAAAFARIVGAF